MSSSGAGGVVLAHPMHSRRPNDSGNPLIKVPHSQSGAGSNIVNVHLPPVGPGHNAGAPNNGRWRGPQGAVPPGATHPVMQSSNSPLPGPSPHTPPTLMGHSSGRSNPQMAPHLPQPHPPMGGMPHSGGGARPMPNRMPQQQQQQQQRPPSGHPPYPLPQPLAGPPSSQQRQAGAIRPQAPGAYGSSGHPAGGPPNMVGPQQSPRPPQQPQQQQQHRQQAPHPPPHQQQQQQQQQTHRGTRVAPVARGPQPTCVEPTRLRDGRRIRETQRPPPQGAGGANAGPGTGAGHPHRFTGPGKNGMAPREKGNNNNGVKAIKLTVDNDETWVKGLTYSTWVDSPRGNLNDLDVKGGPYKRQGGQNNNRRRRGDKDTDSNKSSNSGGVMEMLRNLFR